MEYLTRGQLVDELEQLLENEDLSKSDLRKKLKKLVKRSKVAWNDAQAVDALKRNLLLLLPVIRENPGITYRELAVKTSKSPQYLKNCLKDHPSVEIKPLKDRRGAYGRKPHGLWVKD